MYFVVLTIVIVIILFYFILKQNFKIYTSGAHQRYSSEFTGTNQEHFVNNFNHSNRYADDINKVYSNTPESKYMESFLKQSIFPFNI